MPPKKLQELGTHICDSCGDKYPNRKKKELPGGCGECSNMHNFTFVPDKIREETQNDIHKIIPQTIPKPRTKLKEKQTEEEKFKSFSVVKFLCNGDYEKFKKRVETAIELSKKGSYEIGSYGFLKHILNEVIVREKKLTEIYRKEVTTIAKHIIKNKKTKKNPEDQKKTDKSGQYYLPGFD